MNIQKKEINIQIGKRLQTARENNGYTQELFAEALDVGVEHYRKIEGGLYGLQPDKMLILYEKYKIEPTYLIIGELNHNVDIELYLANCSREDRDLFLEKKQTIVALGAGSITKRVFPDGRIERCDNVKDVGLYIEKIDEMIERKRELFAD